MAFSSQAGLGIARAGQKAYEDRFSPEARDRRDRLRAEKKRRDMALEREQATFEQQKDIDQQQMQLLQAQNNQLLREANKRATYDGLDRYVGDGDVRHLNTMIDTVKQNKAGQKLFGQIVRVDKISPDNITETMIAQQLSPQEAQLVKDGNEEITKDIVRLTNADGSTQVARVSDLMAMTGYTRYADNRELQRLKDIASLRRTGVTTATERQAARIVEQEGLKVGSEEYNKRLTEVITELTAKPAQSDRLSTKQEREAFRVTEAEGLKPDTPEFKARFNEVFDEIVDRDRETTAQKEQAGADEAVQTMIEKAGGEDEFFELDFSKPRLRRKYERDIERLERLGKVELSNTEKKELEYINQLTSLGQPGSTLTEKETGIIDRLIKDTKKYVSDEVEGIDATSAYAAFRNTIRHALFGSVLTEGEIKSFNEQFGTLKQQTGPILAQFRTALEQVRNKLETISETNNSYVIKFRTGRSQEELNNTIDALDERIDAIANFQPTNIEEVEIDPERRRQLELILTESPDEN